MEQLITNVDNIVLGFVQGSFGSLTGIVTTLWRLMFIVFIAAYGYKTMVSGRFSASDLITHCLKIIVVLVLATSWDAFFLYIYRITTELPSDLAGQLMQAASGSLGSQSQAGDIATANAALSRFYDRSMAICEKLLEGASISHWEFYLYVMIVYLSALGFTGFALTLIILAKLAVAIVLAVGPLFILLLVFANTRNLFEGWLKTLLNYAIIPIFVYALLALLLALAESPLRYLEEHSGFTDKVMTSIGPFVLITGISIVLLSQIMNIASSITSGVSLSTLGSNLWASRTAAKGSATTLGWGWRKSEPARKKAAEKMNEVRKAIQRAITKGREAI